jgi:large subunit ribosomal protein L23
MKEPHNIIIRPLITEKTTQQKEDNHQYVFEVYRDANKIEIKSAIEQLFKVKVLKVRTINVIGKVKRVGRKYGKRPDWKKAIVTLREGDRIEFFEGA